MELPSNYLEEMKELVECSGQSVRPLVPESEFHSGR